MAGFKRKHVVIAGGGVAGLEAALALRQLASDCVEVEILAAEQRFSYRPASVAEPFGLGEARSFELAEIAESAGARLTPGELFSVDSERHEAYTAAGDVLAYDALLVACGAVARVAVPGALTFRGPSDAAAFSALLAEVEARAVHRVTFVVPWGSAWVLPLYELALMTAAWVRARHEGGLELTLVTPEDHALEMFGKVASDTVRDLLEQGEITLVPHHYASSFGDGVLRLFPEGTLATDRVVALPRLHGPPIGGIPQTFDGFVPVDAHGRVAGIGDVYAAGDITAFPVKQGGIASQQALVASEAIAAWAGAEVDPQPFHPVLRGMLLTGAQPRYLRNDLLEPEDHSWAAEAPIWWPPAKIAGRHLAPFLAALSGAEPPQVTPPSEETVAVEVELETTELERPSSRYLEIAPARARVRQGATVAEVMTREPLVVAPEDTIGEVAERMRQVGSRAALVEEYGQLLGILTAGDLLHALADRAHPSDVRARQWMTADPVTVREDTPLTTAAALMSEYELRQLPVVAGERVTGIVRAADAEGGGRTHTPRREPDFESGASASSATSAWRGS